MSPEPGRASQRRWTKRAIAALCRALDGWALGYELYVDAARLRAALDGLSEADRLSIACAGVEQLARLAEERLPGAVRLAEQARATHTFSDPPRNVRESNDRDYVLRMEKSARETAAAARWGRALAERVRAEGLPPEVLEHRILDRSRR